MSKADTTGRGPEASEGRLIVFPLANKLVDPPPSKFIACIHPKLCIRWAISDISTIDGNKVYPVLIIYTDSTSWMPCADHFFVIKILNIFWNNWSILHEDGSCSYSFFNSPKLSSIFVWNWAWKLVRMPELISIKILSKRINVLNFKFSSFSDPKSTHSRMIIFILINLIPIFNNPTLTYKTRRNIQFPIKIPPINDSIHNMLF